MGIAETFIQADWPAPPQVKAYCSLRRGGKSLPPFHEFNLALHVEDDPLLVQENREILRQSLHLPAEPVWINQVHGHDVIEALETHRGQDADASYTQQKNQVCVIMTADCLPILICDQKGREVVAIHAGWRGLSRGIIENTLKKLSSPAPELLAWLGPAIGPQKFEVGKDVYDTFLNLSPANKSAFIPSSHNKWLANIYDLARHQLESLGLSQIHGGHYCTYTQEHEFFSYRRDGGKTGRMASLIWLE